MAENKSGRRGEHGFSLIEVVVALLVSMIVLAAVFGSLYTGQQVFDREPEISDLQANARAGIDFISRDLTLAGFKSPATMAVAWDDGGGIVPDEITIIYSDPDVPTSRPLTSGPSSTIENSSVLFIDTTTFDPPPNDPESAYDDDMILFAIETEDCNGDGLGITPFEVTGNPGCSSAGGGGGGGGGGGRRRGGGTSGGGTSGGGGATCPALRVVHNPGGGSSGYNKPQGFNGEVSADCAIIGRFHVVQYRVNPLPPNPNPQLERRNVGTGEPWTPVSANIENLQLQYALRADPSTFVDVPATPDPDDALTWITSVQVSVVGRSESTNLKGGSPGVFAAEDTHVRRTFSTVVSPRNVVHAIEAKLYEGWIPE